jgi:protein SCO1
MRRAALLFLLLVLIPVGWVLVGCSGEKTKALSEPGEKLYTVRGVIVFRDAQDNSLRIDHEAIPGFMEAMTMDYGVRGADVGTLPPDRSRIEAKLHVTQRSYWITDVKRIP